MSTEHNTEKVYPPVKEYCGVKMIYEMSWPEIQEQTEVCDVVIIPIGSIEQHGHHTPVGEDALNALEIAKRIAGRTNSVVAAPIWYGAHMYQQMGFYGSIPIRSDIVKEYLKDVIRGFSRLGFKKIIVLNAHGQQWVLEGALHDLGTEIDSFIAVATWWEFCGETINTVCESSFLHADEAETSVALALYPGLVDMSKAAKETGTPIVDRKYFGGPAHFPKNGGFPGHAITAFHFQKDEYKKGVLGDATKATREKGEIIVEDAVSKISEFIEYLKRRYPPGTKIREKFMD
jgi:creatinine amidohydrolase/Fe(II)-dependent formamide hydrolase-like protein